MVVGGVAGSEVVFGWFVGADLDGFIAFWVGGKLGVAYGSLEDVVGDG